MRDQVFQLFLCPYCNKYTIHMPRLTKEGRWMVDHMLIEGEFPEGMTIAVPWSFCEVSSLDLVKSENFTRTVIRV